MKEIVIGKNQCGQRLDRFLRKYLKEAPDSFIYKMLRKKNIKRNGMRAKGDERLEEGDCVTLYFSEETLKKFSGEQKKTVQGRGQNMPELNIIYENEHIMLIDKPAGMLSQGAGGREPSLVDFVVDYVGKTEEGFSPGICNRLDRNTSGIVIGGKTLLGLQKMSELMRRREIEKYYLAAVAGRMETRGVVEGWLKKDCKTNRAVVSRDAQPDSFYIKTGYEPLQTDGKYTLLRIRLFTGKPHQIRSHLASLSHPVVGDRKYGGPTCGGRVKRQLLHAWELRFPVMEEPFSDLSGRCFRAAVPKDFYQEERMRGLMSALHDEK